MRNSGVLSISFFIYNKVKELNIDYSQGYFFDKPLKYEDIV